MKLGLPIFNETLMVFSYPNFTAIYDITSTHVIAFIHISQNDLRSCQALCTQITQVNMFLLSGSHNGIIIMSLPVQSIRFFLSITIFILQLAYITA